MRSCVRRYALDHQSNFVYVLLPTVEQASLLCGYVHEIGDSLGLRTSTSARQIKMHVLTSCSGGLTSQDFF
jgi:hypothetical protein